MYISSPTNPLGLHILVHWKLKARPRKRRGKSSKQNLKKRRSWGSLGCWRWGLKRRLWSGSWGWMLWALTWLLHFVAPAIKSKPSRSLSLYPFHFFWSLRDDLKILVLVEMIKDNESWVPSPKRGDFGDESDVTHLSRHHEIDLFCRCILMRFYSLSL